MTKALCFQQMVLAEFNIHIGKTNLFLFKTRHKDIARMQHSTNTETKVKEFQNTGKIPYALVGKDYKKAQSIKKKAVIGNFKVFWGVCH